MVASWLSLDFRNVVNDIVRKVRSTCLNGLELFRNSRKLYRECYRCDPVKSRRHWKLRNRAVTMQWIVDFIASIQWNLGWFENIVIEKLCIMRSGRVDANMLIQIPSTFYSR